eukprot:365496-Chlamydomonas_euryale.AAC.1
MPCEKACSWLGRSCALLAMIGICRRYDTLLQVELGARRAERPQQPHWTAGGPSRTSGEPLQYIHCI